MGEDFGLEVHETGENDAETTDLRNLLGDVGIHFDQLSTRLQERLRQIKREQHTLTDDLRCAHMARQVAENLRERGAHDRLTETDWKNIEMASVLTDLGKTGPENATAAQSALISHMYAIDKALLNDKGRREPASWSVERFVKECMSERDFSETKAILETLGVRMDMNMREFYNMHAQWTNDLIKNESTIPAEVRTMAALHHILENVNPDTLVDLSTDDLMIPSLRRPIGEQEIWVLLFDKYEAQTNPHRGKQSHDKGVKWLRDFVNEWPMALAPYPTELKQLINDCIDQLDKTFRTPQETSTSTASLPQQEEAIAAK